MPKQRYHYEVSLGSIEPIQFKSALGLSGWIPNHPGAEPPEELANLEPKGKITLRRGTLSASHRLREWYENERYLSGLSEQASIKLKDSKGTVAATWVVKCPKTLYIELADKDLGETEIKSLKICHSGISTQMM